MLSSVTDADPSLVVVAVAAVASRRMATTDGRTDAALSGRSAR